MIVEILEQILVRLPVKTLVRLKATCKTWRSLINSDSFIELHHRRHRLDYHDRLLYCDMIGAVLVVGQDHDHRSFLMYSCDTSAPGYRRCVSDMGWIPRVAFNKWFPFDAEIAREPWALNRSSRPRASCRFSPYTTEFGPLNNGIYFQLIVDCQITERMSIGTSKFALCNLATREYKFLNPFPALEYGFIFPLKADHVHYGFGSVHNETGFVVDYKVVVVVLSGPDCIRFSSYVYSVRRGRWDKIADVERGVQFSSSPWQKSVSGLVDKKGQVQTPKQTLYNFGVVQCPQAFLNGSWHWLEKRVHNAGEYDRVLLFDFAKEMFGWIQGPHVHEYQSQYPDLFSFSCGLLVLDHHLAMVYLPHRLRRPSYNKWLLTKFDVWMMMDYGNKDSWTKIYSCDAFRGNFSGCCLLGLCYSTTNVDPSCSSSSSSEYIQIQRVCLRERDTHRTFAWNGSEITEHDAYFKSGLRKLWNTAGVSNYVETLAPLTLTH